MKLKVISFNIRCCDDPNENSIAQRAPRLFTVTSQYQADILCLQEYRPQWEEYIQRFYGNEYHIFVRYRNLITDVEASPILWRKNKFECIKSGYFWLSDTPEEESRGWDTWGCYRMCLYVVLKEKESGKEFTVMNTHFGFGDECHTNSVDLMYRYYKKISTLPTFITGDFNMVPQSIGYQAMTKHFRDVNACTVNDLSTTFHNYQPDTVEPEHVDYCFINQDIVPIYQKIITETVNGKFPSDHYGIYMELDV